MHQGFTLQSGLRTQLPVPEAGVVVLLGAVGTAVVVVISMLLRVVLAVAAVVEAGPESGVVVLLGVVVSAVVLVVSMLPRVVLAVAAVVEVGAGVVTDGRSTRQEATML